MPTLTNVTNGIDYALTSTASETTWVVWNVAWTSGTTNATTIATTWSSWNDTYVYEMAGRDWHQTQVNRAHAEVAADRSLRDQANANAAKLLAEYLDARQRDTYEKHKWFEVVSPRGRTFRVKRGRAGNVYLMENGREAVRYCIHPVEYVPDEDTMIAQALMIGAEEDVFERTANKTRIAA